MFLPSELTRTAIYGSFLAGLKILTFLAILLQSPIAKNLNESLVCFISDFESGFDTYFRADEPIWAHGAFFGVFGPVKMIERPYFTRFDGKYAVLQIWAMRVQLWLVSGIKGTLGFFFNPSVPTATQLLIRKSEIA